MTDSTTIGFCLPVVRPSARRSARHLVASQLTKWDLQAQVGFLGVNLKDGVRAGRRVGAQTGITDTVAPDPDEKLFQSFGVMAVPTTMFIDAGGKVVDVNSGELSAGELRPDRQGAAVMIDAPLALAFTAGLGGHGHQRGRPPQCEPTTEGT